MANTENLYNEVDSSLAAINAIPGTITENSVHNNESLHLNDNRDVDSSLKIDKSEKVSLDLLESKKEAYKSIAAFDVAHFQNKRPISKTLSDLNDQRLLDDIKNEIARSTEIDTVLAEAINLEDEEREKADAQLKVDIAKEALARANSDSDLAGIIEKYKLAMSQHITTRELDVNGDTRINLEVQDADYHGGNLEVQASLVVGNEDSNGLETKEGKIIGDAHIKHDLTVDNDLTVGGDTIYNGNLRVKKNLTVDGDTTLVSKVNIKDDNNNEKVLSDVIGTIKNALVKDFTQTYDSSTGKLTSKLEFQNYHNGNSNRPTVETIEKTIDLDLEKFVVEINDVYATKATVNGKVTYTDIVPTEEQLKEIDKADYSGNIVRCLKVKYSTHGNDATFENSEEGKAGVEYSYVYFEINDVFNSTNAKHDKDVQDLYTYIDNDAYNRVMQYMQDHTVTYHVMDANDKELFNFKSVVYEDTGDKYLRFNQDISFRNTTIV